MGDAYYWPEAIDVIADVCRQIIDVRFEVVRGAATHGSKAKDSRGNRTVPLTFAPDGTIDHHTGRGSYGNLRDYVHHGVDYGPLCNELVSDPSDTGGVCIVTVIGCGRASHAGVGALPDGTVNGGNRRRWGREFQNDGVEPWHPLALEVGVQIDAALLTAMGRTPAEVGDAHQEHAEYATPPGRKPDRHGIDGPSYRAVIADRMTPRSRPVKLTRIAGTDRHDTQAKLAQTRFGVGKWPTVFLALTESPEVAGSGNLDGPVLTVTRDGIPPATAAALKAHQPDEVVALGGTATIPESVLQEAGKIAGGGTR